MITVQQALARLVEQREIFHDEMLSLMRQIMGGELTPAQIAAIVMARYQRLNPSGSARSKPISLIVDATLQLPESVEPVRQLELLVQRLSEPIQRGQVQLIIARSYQKYQALGSGKMMGGCTTLIHANAIAAGAAFLRKRDSSSFRGLDEVQFFTHILKHAAPSELSMAGTATRNASTLAAELFPSPMAQVTSPFVVRGEGATDASQLRR